MEEQGGEAAQRRHLREGEVHEDDLPGDDVQAEVAQHGDEHHAGDERRQHQLETGHGRSLSGYWAAAGAAPKARTSSPNHRLMRSKYVATPAWPPTFDGTMTAVAPVRWATSRTWLRS